MCLGLQLQIALLRVGAVVLLESALDVDRVCVMSFNEIAVVAVHGPDEIGQRRHHAVRQASPKPRGCRRQLDREVIQLGAVPRAV